MTVNAPDADMPPPTHTVSVEGSFGSVSWQVDKTLFDILPRDKRQDVLDVSGEGRIAPFFETTCTRLLSQAGNRGVSSASLSRDSSLETIIVECGIAGSLYWTLSQGLWDNIPADQRANLLLLAEEAIHEFLENELAGPLYSYARRTFRS